MAQSAWEKLEGETDAAFTAFIKFRDLGSARTIDKAYVAHQGASGGTPAPKRAPGSWREWKQKHRWTERSAAWDSREVQPSTHGNPGQDATGKFTAGNQLGRGNPLAGRSARIRAVLLEEFTPERAKAVIHRLIRMAVMDGDLAAIKELLDRSIGKPGQLDVLERIEKLENLHVEKDADA